MLYHFKLYYTILYYILLCYIILYYIIILYYFICYHFILKHIILYYIHTYHFTSSEKTCIMKEDWTLEARSCCAVMMFPTLWTSWILDHRVPGWWVPHGLPPKSQRSKNASRALTENSQILLESPTPWERIWITLIQFDRISSLKIPICVSWSILLILLYFFLVPFWPTICLHQPISTSLSTEK